MSAKTKIQWCDSTCNPTMGCDGCELWSANVKKCYAGTLHTRFGGVTPGYARTFEGVTPFPGRMQEAAGWSDLTGLPRTDKPWLNKYPRLIFVSDMSDALSSAVSFDYLNAEVIQHATSEKGKRHCWLWLTKRPERMAKFSKWLESHGSDWPSNLWAGTSVTSQVTTSRIKHLLQVGNESTIRFLSVEPQIEPVELSAWLPSLDWIIQGGESGRGARAFEIAWATSLMEQCRSHGVAYFLKQLGACVMSNGKRMQFEDGHGGDWAEWPKKIRVRQLPALGRVSVPSTNPAIGAPKNTLGPRSQAALKAWATRRAKASGNATTNKRSQAALKAWATRRAKGTSDTSPTDRRQAALKAWVTRRAKLAGNPAPSDRTQAALKAWETRRKKADNTTSSKRRLAALKAWDTRRAKSNDGSQ